MRSFNIYMFFIILFVSTNVFASTIENCGDGDSSKSEGKMKVTPEFSKILKKDGTADVSLIPLCNSVVLGNPDGKKKLFVFTDPECPFCSKMHLELIKLVYMDPDLAILIKMFPLKMHPNAYDKARVILGGDAPYLLNKAFAGEQLPPPGPKDLNAPVDESIKLAESLGINGTPTLIFPNGKIVPGYKEAGEIKKLLSR